MIPIGPTAWWGGFFFPSFSPSFFFFFFSLFPFHEKKKRPLFLSQPSIVLIFFSRYVVVSLPAYSFSAGRSSIFGFPFRMGKIQTLKFRPSRNTLRCKKAKRPFAGRKKIVLKKHPPQCFNEAKGLREQGTLKNKTKTKIK